jgi:hypothetical protein
VIHVRDSVDTAVVHLVPLTHDPEKAAVAETACLQSRRPRWPVVERSINPSGRIHSRDTPPVGLCPRCVANMLEDVYALTRPRQS